MWSRISRSVAGIIAAIVLVIGSPVCRAQDGSGAGSGASGGGTTIRLPEIPVDEIRNARVEDAGAFVVANRSAVILAVAGVILALLFINGTIRKSGFKKIGPRKIEVHPAFMWLFAAMMVYLAWQTGAQLIAQMSWVQNGAAGQTLQRQGVMGLVGYAIGIAVGLGMLHLLARSAPDAGLRIRIGDLWIGLWAFALVWPIVEASSIIAVWVEQAIGEQTPQIAHPLLAQIVESPNDPWRWVVIASVVLGAPIVEELVYRVFIQSAIIRVIGGVWPGVLITAVIFALVHRAGDGGGVPWVAIVPIFVLGLAMGIAYERTQRVGVPILMHVAFNALNVGLALWAGHGGGGGGEVVEPSVAMLPF
ncbi:MAG: CPBP family intramembrane metalloprotease [Phycisphaeraceae bacterium]|nr:CPBP family intramembrane metalloprotease [Phycisphaeraceae bacterium]